MKVAITLLTVIFAIFLSINTYGQFTYTDFSSTNGLSILVNASQVGNTIRLTPASSGQRGAIWYTTKQYVQIGFETVFQFQFTGQGGISPAGADGIAFVIQNVSETTIGPSTGGSLAYAGITNSVAVEFDTWPNGEFGDPNGNHISVQTRGLTANSSHHNYSLGAVTTIPNLKNQSVYTAKILYSGGQLKVYLNDLNNPVLTVNINLATTLNLDNGKAYVGFTSATGNSYENHFLLNWTFELKPSLNIEISAPYTNQSEFYPRTPQGLNKYLFNVRITTPTLPIPPLNNISVIATLDGNPLALQLNTSLVTLDSDNNGMIDQLPAAQKPSLNYIEFIASTGEYTSNQLNKPLIVNIASVNGYAVNISATDVVSLYFAKQGNNVYSLTSDAYSFGNSSELQWSDVLFLYHKYGVGKGWWIYTYLNNFVKSTFGRCFGMTTTSGAYFLYPEMKPLVDTVYRWNPPPQIVSEKINLAHISQKLYSVPVNVNATFGSLISNLSDNKLTNLGMLGEKIGEPTKTGGHAVLAVGMTVFNNQNNAFIHVYDPNIPDSSYTARIYNGNQNFYYKSSGYLFNQIGAFPQNSFLNWKSLEYYYTQYLNELNASLYQANSKVFGIACPVNLLVTNSQGLRVGYLSNGDFINEIPNAKVQRAPTNDAVGDSVTVISVPLDDEYELVMNSFGTGNLVFEHIEPIDSTILFTTASDTIPITNQTICHFYESDSTHLYLDIDGNGTIDSTVNLHYSLLNLPLPGTIYSNINQGWNLISNPVTREANTDSVRQLYPNSEFDYVYKLGTQTGYQQTHTMPNGIGFWGKFPNIGVNTIDGGVRDIDTIDVSAGWNIVGSLSVDIDTSTIISIPPNIRSSNWYGFSGGYTISNIIVPAAAYWIKTNSAGKFIFSAREQMNKKNVIRENLLDQFNSITIADGTGNAQTLYFGVDVKKEIIQAFFEMPPSPPIGIFDARFRTEDGDFILLTHSNDKKGDVEYPIVIQSGSNILSISWNIKTSETNYELNDGLGGKIFNSKILVGQGSVQITKVDNIFLNVSDEGLLPTKFDLSQNYPNPFNPITTIRFSVPKEVQVELNIYNILGEKVKELKNEVMKPGYYEVEFDGTALASGIYFYSIKAGDFVETKKMVLIK